MDEKHKDDEPAGCPHAAAAHAEAEGNGIDIVRPVIPAPGGVAPVAAENAAGFKAMADHLYTVAQVEALMEPHSPLAQIVHWVRRFLGRPNRDLGRPGPVCPFVPGAVAQDTVWLTLAEYGPSDRAAIVEAVDRYRNRFLELEPKQGDLAQSKAILIVFPNLSSADAALIDQVQFELKSSFVEEGMMLGEFHEQNESPGLRNPDFRPLRSPIPMLAMRYMVETDLPFLHRSLYPAPLRAEFIRAYLRRLGSFVHENNFNAAVESLVQAEIERRRAGEARQEVPVRG